jgi:hypothetical protein
VQHHSNSAASLCLGDSSEYLFLYRIQLLIFADGAVVVPPMMVTDQNDNQVKREDIVVAPEVVT